MKRHALDKRNIIKKASDFNEVFNQGMRVSSTHLTLFFQDHNRLMYGFATSKKLGKAVTRNFAKRRLRELLRRHLDLLPEGVRLVLLARPGMERQRFDKLENEFIHLLKKVSAQISKQ